MVPRDGYTLTEDDKTNFPLQLESDQPLLPKWRRVQDVVCGWRGILAWACASTFMLIITSITLAVVTRHRRAPILYNCLYALGGGEVFDGNFPQTRILSPECEKAYRTYFSGPYHQDVNMAVSEAAEYFSNLHTANRSQVVVFDIDETALSNLPEWQRFQLSGLAEDAAARSAWQLEAKAPALRATRSLYNELYRKGFSVTFLTGSDLHLTKRERQYRHEGTNNRALTAANLEYAGYGKQCSEVDAQSEPCYVQLDMREDNDTRLASIYKPDRRAQLQAHGYTVVGSFGDQWSDLAGTSPAVASFKLPNPMYYIL